MTKKNASRLRRFVFTALILAGYLVLADALATRWMAAGVARPDFRFLVRSMAGLPELTAYLAASDQPDVLFVGDSILQGGAAGMGPVTIASGYDQARRERSGRAVRIVNGANAGSSIEVNQLVVDRLLTPRTETVFVLVNYRAFTRDGIPAVYAPWLGVNVVDKANTFNRTGNAADRFVTAHSSLYRNREWLIGHRLGAPLDRALSRFFYVATLVGWRDAVLREFRVGRPRLWSDSVWSEAAQAKLRESFDIPALSLQDENFARLGALAEKVRRDGSEFVAVMPPLNREMVQRFDLIDERVFAHNLDLLRHVTEKAGGLFLDAGNWQPGNVFTDSVHMIATGNLSFGRRLAQWHLGEEATP